MDTCSGAHNLGFSQSDGFSHFRVCERRTATFSCSGGRLLRLGGCWYGSPQSDPGYNECPRSSTEPCSPVTGNCINYIQQQCDNKQSCSVTINNGNMGGDPCPTIGKFAGIALQCYCPSGSVCGDQCPDEPKTYCPGTWNRCSCDTCDGCDPNGDACNCYNCGCYSKCSVEDCGSCPLNQITAPQPDILDPKKINWFNFSSGSLYINSTLVILLCGIVILILFINVAYMSYNNCCKNKKNKYDPIKMVDSDIDSEINPININ